MGFGLQSARFHTTVAKRSQIPPANVPEVAFAGRSNSGKSSAINRLCQRKRLAFASKTPGRTQALNYFALGPEDQPAQAYLVDTPGYGYAAVPGDVKRQWQDLAGWYLVNRPTLRALVLMIDCRRLLTDKDVDLLHWTPPEVERLILVTKADKLKQQARQRTMLQIQDQYAQAAADTPASFLLFSSVSGLGLDAARQQILDWLVTGQDEPPTEPKSSRPAKPSDGKRKKRQPKKNPAATNAPGYKPVNRGTRSGRRSG